MQHCFYLGCPLEQNSWIRIRKIHEKHVVSLTYFSFAHPTLAADHWGVVGGVAVVAGANHCYLAGGH